MKKLASKLLAVLLIVSLLTAGLPARTFAASAEPQSAGEVDYVTEKWNGKTVVYNWGTRGTVATFISDLTTDPKTGVKTEYYTGSYTYEYSSTDPKTGVKKTEYCTGSYTYEYLSTLSGSNVHSDTGTLIYNSKLGTAIHSMLTAKQTYTSNYDDAKTAPKFTESQQSNTSKLTTFYTGQQISNTWDSGATWNREHTWPNSKGLNGSDENDVAMLKPELSSENSGRGNTAYGESSGYYDPNQFGQNMHGDVARMLLQHLMRWGNTSKFYGSGGVIESRAVLLKWLAEDPVDTWEMGRNDALQTITGVRNIFVDYPELAFKLLGEEVPDGYITPSGSEDLNYVINVTVNNSAYGSATINGRTITAVPAEGYCLVDAVATAGTATATVTDENKIRVSASSDCTITVNFAPITYVTVTCIVNGATLSSAAIQTGKKAELSAVSDEAFPGYTFIGWTTGELAETVSKPTLYTDSYIPTEDTALYAVFARSEEGGEGSVSQFTLVKDQSQLTAGAEVVIAAAEYGYAMGKDLVSNKSFSRVPVTKSGDTIIDLDETAGIAIFTLNAGSVANTWSFYNSEIGGYLASSNHYADGTTTTNAMLAESSLTADSSFTVALSDGKALLTSKTSNTWNLIKYNDSNSRFSCYKATSGDVTDVALYVKSGSYTTYYTTAPGADLEYTVTATANNDDYGTVNVLGYSIVCKPADGYELSDVTVTAGTATWTVKDNVITVTPSTDCTVTVIFAEKEIPPFKYLENTAYRYALVQKGLSGSPTLYFTGVKDGNFFATTQTEADGADVYVEYVDGGYRLYFMNGATKTYLDIYEYTTGKAGIELTATPSAVYTYDDTYDIFVADVLGTKYTFGTYGTFNTIRKIAESYFEKIDTEEYPARLLPTASEPPVTETVHISYIVNGTPATDGDVTKGTTVALAAPSKTFDGFTYKGWTTTEVTTETATAPTILTSFTAATDLTLHAVFQNNSTKGYTTRPQVATVKAKITYMADGNLFGTQTVTAGTAVKLLTTAPGVTGFTFAGWSATPIEAATATAPVFPASPVITADITYYAVYKNTANNKYTTAPTTAPETVHITFVINGTPAVDDYLKKGSTVTFAEPSKSFDGYTYVGWVTDEVLTETAAVSGILTSITLNEDTTVYALFRNDTTELFTTRPVLENKVLLSPDSARVSRGDQFRITVSVRGALPFTSLSYSAYRNENYYFDNSAFELLDIRRVTTTATIADSQNGDFAATWEEPGVYTEALFELVFMVLDTAENGEYTFSGEALARNSVTGKDVSITVESLTVQVADYIPGDVNNDGAVNDADAVYLLFYTFYPEDYPINQNGDFNGDGVVNDADAIHLLFYTFYPEDYPLH